MIGQAFKGKVAAEKISNNVFTEVSSMYQNYDGFDFVTELKKEAYVNKEIVEYKSYNILIENSKEIQNCMDKE